MSILTFLFTGIGLSMDAFAISLTKGFCIRKDALAVGISFAFLSVNIVKASLVISITTFIICFFGVYFGKLIGKYIQKYSEILGGLILIGIGIKILIEHLIGNS